MPAHSYTLTDLTWDEVRDHLTRDQRLILAAGACDQYGHHLPLAAGTRIADSIADALSREFGILRAPTLPYGVNLAARNLFPGAATLRTKTLHGVLNELLGAWEDQGFEEIILVTAHAYEPHIEALATVNLERVRVRVIHALGIDLSLFSEEASGVEHGGEITTSLLMYLYPEIVRLDRALDVAPPAPRWNRSPRLTEVPQDTPGAVGYPSRASAAKGEQMYQYILQKIREKVFGAPSAVTDRR
jgi:creatinine amidohydrolase